MLKQLEGNIGQYIMRGYVILDRLLDIQEKTKSFYTGTSSESCLDVICNHRFSKLEEDLKNQEKTETRYFLAK